MMASEDKKHIGANNSYWGNIKETVSTLTHGLKLTFRHMLQARKSRQPLGVEDANYFEQDTGIFTTQYPHESLPVPDHGRYRLHNEIDDCIVCDKCAKVCPVDCIDIEPIRSAESFGNTSDGTPKRLYAAKFDIDMGKCCFCGLCTTVCPTECLTMTKTYDFSEYDIRDHNYAFAEMTPLEILEKQQAWEEHQATKASQKTAGTTASAKPAMPKINPAAKAAEADSASAESSPKPKPVFKPKMPVKKATGSSEEKTGDAAAKSTAKPVIKPKIPVKKATTDDSAKAAEDKPKSTAKSTVKPVIKPKIPVKKATTEDSAKAAEDKPKNTAKSTAKPVIKPKIPVKKAAAEDSAKTPEDKPKSTAKSTAKPVIKPKIPKKPGTEPEQ